jgi:radical SAM-linked protein
MEFVKFRLRFQKTGLLRLVSHHDLMRVLERMLRRARLPFRSTSGFHPLPRVIFALSLPLGVEGLHEVVEIELTEPMDASSVLSRIQAQSPDGLTFLSIREVAKNASAQVRQAGYSIDVPPERTDELSHRCKQLLAQSSCISRREKPHARDVDIRPYMIDLRVDGSSLKLDFLVTANGTARADEVLKLLDASDLLEQGFILSRTHLHLHEEIEQTGAAPAAVSSGISEFSGAVLITDLRMNS